MVNNIWLFDSYRLLTAQGNRILSSRLQSCDYLWVVLSPTLLGHLGDGV